MKHWEQVPLRRVFRVVNGGTPTTDPDNWGGAVPWATPIDLGRCNGGLITSTARTLSAHGLKTGSAAVPSGSLVVSTRAPIGYVVQTVGPLAFNQGCRGLSPARPLDLRYYRYVLVALGDHMQASGQGSTFVELSTDALASTRLPLPPPEAQRGIAEFLDGETFRIDSLVAKKHRLVDVAYSRLRARAATLTAAAVTVDLNRGGARVWEGWRAMRLRRCLGQIDYGIGEASKPAGDIAVLGMGNIDDRGRIVGEPGGYVESVDSRLLLHPGDLLFNRTNSLAKVGKVGLVRELAGPTTFASYLVRFRSSSVADTAYLNYALNTEDVLGLARSTALPSIGQANLNPSRYSELYVSLPSMDEQHRIVHDLDAERRHTEVLGSRLTRQIGLLQERRQALITAAVTGELDIPGVAA